MSVKQLAAISVEVLRYGSMCRRREKDDRCTNNRHTLKRLEWNRQRPACMHSLKRDSGLLDKPKPKVMSKIRCFGIERVSWSTAT